MGGGKGACVSVSLHCLQCKRPSLSNGCCKPQVWETQAWWNSQPGYDYDTLRLLDHLPCNNSATSGICLPARSEKSQDVQKKIYMGSRAGSRPCSSIRMMSPVGVLLRACGRIPGSSTFKQVEDNRAVSCRGRAGEQQRP